MIVIKDLSKMFKTNSGLGKPVQALKNISFAIHPGRITGFLGANGAGKTTTIKCLFDLIRPDTGEILYFGKSGLTYEARRRIGFLPERPYFYEYLTGREFLRFYGKISLSVSHLEMRGRIEEMLKRVGLTHAADRPLRSYSKGMLQRIGIAQALIHRPELVILDEPMTGLDPDGRFEVRQIIRESVREGCAVFFSSHLLPDAEEICDSLVILKKGELVYDGAMQDLLQKFGAASEIKYFENSQQKVQTVQSQAELQATLDRLRAARLEILEVRPLRQSLEEAFVKIGFDQKSPENQPIGAP